MNAPEAALKPKKHWFHGLGWQRVSVQQMNIRRPGREALLWIAYSTFYVFLSAATGFIIRHERGVGTLFFGSPWYFLFFKIGGLLVVPLVIFYRQGYTIRDLLLDWRPTLRTLAIAAGAFAIGLMVNWSHTVKLMTVAHQMAGSAVAWRIASGITLPLFMAGIPEEIVYRGILQTRLEAVMGRVGAILLQTALFAAWHFPSRYLLSRGVEGQAGNAWSVFVGTVAPVFVVGLIFSILWDRYRRLVPLIALHWGVDVLPTMSTLFGIPV